MTYEQITPPKSREGIVHRRLGRALIGLGMLAIFVALGALVRPPFADAHIVQEEPWHPVAAAYRTSLFFAALSPVPWSKIEAAWTGPHPAAASKRPPIALLEALPKGPEAAAAIRKAIDAGDRQALFETTTRATSHALRSALAEAAAAVESGTPHGALNEARQLYRAFDEAIAAADPAGYRQLGIAWLELTSSAGASGISGAGQLAADPERFEESRSAIDRYFKANYEPSGFTNRTRVAPLPETIVAVEGETQVPPRLPPGSFIGDQSPLPRLVLGFEEEGIEETDLPLVAFGDMLFDSPMIFGEPARSIGIACATCHNRGDVNRDLIIPGASHQKGAVDVDGGFFNPLFNDRRDDPIDIPSLRGLRFTGPYGRDGRFASLRDFSRNVIVNEFNGPEPTPFMLDALLAYMTEFDFLPNSKLTGDGRLTEEASDEARRGEAIFKRPFAQMDGKSCASCHIPSANFLDRRAHDIGSAQAGYGSARAGAFDTPTLLGTRFNAPYFHDGALPTLASVVDWFDERYALGLSDTERSDLSAYLETVGDADEPFETFDERNTPFRLAFNELTTFATALDTLIPRRDARHALLLIETVSTDLTADASGMANFASRPEAYELSETLGSVGAAVRDEDWPLAERRWEVYKARQAEIAERMF